MTHVIKPHLTTRRGFIAATGFGGVSLYGLWAAYGAAPGPRALLGLDHTGAAPHGAGEGAVASADGAMPAMEGAHGGHAGGAAPGSSDAEAFSRESAAFSERFRMPDGRVYPRRIAMPGSGAADPHAGHDMTGMAPAPALSAPAGPQVGASGHSMAGQAESTGAAEDGPIDVLMTAGKWYYLPNALRLDAGQRYRFRMMAMDVGHGASIHLGSSGRMMRLQPGRVAQTELRFARPGRYLVYCTVYCGVAHDVMQASIEVV